MQDEENKLQQVLNRVSDSYIQVVQQRARVIVVSFISGGVFGVLCFAAGYLANG